MDITKKDIFKYTFLPGFLPRFKELFGTGFQFIAFFIASVYGAVGLLPHNHPYTQPQNIGRFGIRHVIAEAANSLTFSSRHIDQIILFICVLVGLIIVSIQLFLLLFVVIMQPALAAMPTNFAGFFLTGTPNDLAYMMLDLVFGVPGMFNSCIAAGGGCVDGEGRLIEAPGIPNWGLESTAFPFPIHTGLHRLFAIYSYGLLTVAVMITLYFVVTVIGETAQSGTAFGKRFNKVWAPIRIVVAFGLLIPIGVGLNASQYIVLYAAKFGTGFANQGWNTFTSSLTTMHGLQTNELVGEPNIPEVGALLQFLFTAKTCAEVENAIHGTSKAEIEPFFVREQTAAPPQRRITAGPTGTTYDDMANFADTRTQLIIRFGRLTPRDNSRYAGLIAPTCGELVFPLLDPRTTTAATPVDPAIGMLQAYYLFVIKEIWFEALNGDPVGSFLDLDHNFPNHFMKRYMVNLNTLHDPDITLPDEKPRIDLLSFYQRDVRAILNDPASTGLGPPGSLGAIEIMSLNGRWNIDTTMRDKGWACAACIYNRIAEMNGAITTAALNIPMPTRYPMIMEEVHDLKRTNNVGSVVFEKRFEPVISGETEFKFSDGEAFHQANTMWQAFDYWQQGGGVSSPHSASTGNAVVDIINALMGTEGIFSMRRNASVHPIAQLSMAGKALVEASIRNLSYAAVAAGGGAGLRLQSDFLGKAASIPSQFLITIAMITLTAGFILYYVLPFLPFIYFFFAFGGWVKGIFEAMVGAPLWALAHIRIDGNGLSGQAALSGYFLIFEVFLRPILMVFGLIASISIFSALVKVLNQIFSLVVANVGGFDVTAEFTGIGASELSSMRGAIDEFFFTVVYVIIVYMIGMSSFKLVDLIPNNILRWMGQSVATFGDQKDDPTQKLISTTSVGSQQTTSAIGGGLESIAKLGGR